jgi:FtsP/CotA-like multicopper oxidase with cupredoxin domain
MVHKTQSSGGVFNGFDFSETQIGGPNTFDTFSCNQFKSDLPTPDATTPTRRFHRKVVDSIMVRMNDGREIEFWGFEARDLDPRVTSYPSPPIRCEVGDIVHTLLETRFSSHTIHHHGIEPTTMNDGAGHVSFEVDGAYTYQWQPRHAGTFFYHCHKNTTLHFEMGMLGLLIVDPPRSTWRALPGGVVAKPAYIDTRPGRDTTYVREGLWVYDDVDPRWHMLHHDAGLCNEDAGLNRFEPKYFLCSGVPSHRTETDSRTVVTATHGEKVLIRVLNASYGPLRVSLPGAFRVPNSAPPVAQMISVDGHSLDKPWNDWIRFDISQGTFTLNSAQRCDILIDTSRLPNPGVSSGVPRTQAHQFDAEFYDWTMWRVKNLNATDGTLPGRLKTRLVIRGR